MTRDRRTTRDRRPSPGEEANGQPAYGAAAIAATLVFLLYASTLAHSTAMWDTSEYIAAAYVLGIPHPPGNPFFVLLGHVFTLLPIAPTIAQRVNVMAALTSAASAGIWFLVAERVLAGWLSSRWLRMVGASAAVLIGATTFTVWDQSIVNEKVYTISLLFFAIVAWLMVRWSDDPHGPRADKLLILSAFLVGLGYTNHPAGFLVIPAVGVAILARRPRVLLDRRLIVRCAAALALGLTPFLFEPIRAAQFPALNEGETTACESHLALSCTLDHETWRRVAAHITREQYGPHDDRRATGAALRAGWDVLALLQVAVGPRRDGPASRAAERGRRTLPRSGSVWRATRTGATIAAACGSSGPWSSPWRPRSSGT